MLEDPDHREGAVDGGEDGVLEVGCVEGMGGTREAVGCYDLKGKRAEG